MIWMELKTGKIPWAVRDRQIKNKGLNVPSGRAISSGCIGGKYDPEPEMTAAYALNLCAARGECPSALELQVLLSPGTEEEELGKICARMERFASDRGIALGGVDAFTTGSLSGMMLTAAAFGEGAKTPGTARSGMVLYAAGEAGLAGASVAARAGEKELSGRFSKAAVRRMLEGAGLSLPSAECLKLVSELAGKGAVVLAAGEGGVFAALWELAAFYDIGFEADLRAIPIRQETVEICEFFDLNPYQLYSSGMFLIAMDESFEADVYAAERGLRLARIGRLEKPPVKRIYSGEEIRDLEKPGRDMLRILEDRT